jgi:transportin-3
MAKFSVCLTIGAYSKWLDASSDGFPLLSSVIKVLLSGMSKSEDSAAAAAVAFRHICDGTVLFSRVIIFTAVCFWL